MMKEKTKDLIETLRRLLLEKDLIKYSDDTLIQVAITKEIERIKREYTF